jgi:hypothetical protein
MASTQAPGGTTGRTFLTSDQLAERHHRTTKGVLQDHYRGIGPRAHKIGKRLLFDLVDVEAWEESRAEMPRPAA